MTNEQLAIEITTSNLIWSWLTLNPEWRDEVAWSPAAGFQLSPAAVLEFSNWLVTNGAKMDDQAEAILKKVRAIDG
jgi:hypothetical protein